MEGKDKDMKYLIGIECDVCGSCHCKCHGLPRLKHILIR